MSRISAAEPIAQTATGKATDLRDVDVGRFLDLLIAQLRNQDPLDPIDNAEMAQQLSQIRQISATDKLTDTLGAVLTGQSLATASGLIGKQVEALSPQGESVRGVVDRVTAKTDHDQGGARQYRIHIGEHAFDLDRVREIATGQT